MTNAKFLDCRLLSLWAWRTIVLLGYAALFYPILSLDCAGLEGSLHCAGLEGWGASGNTVDNWKNAGGRSTHCTRIARQCTSNVRSRKCAAGNAAVRKKERRPFQVQRERERVSGETTIQKINVPWKPVVRPPSPHTRWFWGPYKFPSKLPTWNELTFTKLRSC